MGYTYSIQINSRQKMDEVYMNSFTMNKLNIKHHSIQFCYGQHRSKLMININNHLKDGHISIPQQISEQIIIPRVPYDYQINQNELRLGPVIGYMVLKRTFASPQNRVPRFVHYDQFKGVVFLFTSTNMDKESFNLPGYYYDPVRKRFMEGVFPYPDAIYTRSNVKFENYKHLREKIGDRIFNYPYRADNKRKFWKKMSADPNIKQHLPFTQPYMGIDSVLQMLKEYGSVYLKPINLNRGKGIFQIIKENERYILMTRKNERFETRSIEKLNSMVTKHMIQDKSYIIQQTVEFKSGLNRIDFRAYIQKDESLKWNLSGMEARIAKKGSIITNMTHRMMVEMGDHAFKKHFQLTQDEIIQIKNKILQIGAKILNEIENSNRNYHLGDAAIDLVVDSDLKIWILEVQMNYGAEVKRGGHISESKIFPYILQTPFFYAKALAGFGESNDTK
ncbi:YheC/YheD family protein [Chengkuizengella axinellae]|uniref:YheC/YheD family protein n=1 Tax=Chengkuizengella axinellae TaxID=3064388 RepID=A0ABT9IYX2_9BACL|nr:YheC/YheD family protein [Chengkuizengella sp. 2205SS18-9]MDP5274571.1 YheC/YheD family protein [Chengkuizengella sp. 2205SS18-9]